MPDAVRDRRPRRITVDPEGPILVEGPVEVVREDGTVAASDRFAVAICTCRRTRTAPWCDTSHRRHRRPCVTEQSGRDEPRGDPE
ncbi:CDGSH iron-sulfur domain-containing protein [Streptomyces sp. NBC_00669]|uniref:CDGSH iron-sulfur domain-containing protein n=1 Tax=Streptomyces sp. NBC_00669 TaxID=2976011 RepID=UPI002E3356D0|nr:CDGSH iron-sulfur domain-containing protein [Streptomyces sp. NBC_00669]